ncbi:hypothetical protein PSU4_18990 [Pseudonocardia sulfidoxydans NBRC 16205]|uniref:Uncharacterized protein n=1 Tax=Pseudonocardia sulfidoxydans NBRC 16205 TaxID=1223511 RepID=A0A511DDR7_9PSEU|nr:hypothetical protein PSU4_18990 [Pseudonocardia sulfidoxydans NBRC 16205]
MFLLTPSPRYVDDGDYRGGFSAADVHELLESLDSKYLGWSGAMAPVIMGAPDRPELAQELTDSFCRTDPLVAGVVARATFPADNRAEPREGERADVGDPERAGRDRAACDGQVRPPAHRGQCHIDRRRHRPLPSHERPGGHG